MGERAASSDAAWSTALGGVSVGAWTILLLGAQGLAPFPLCTRGGAFTRLFAPDALGHGLLMLAAMMAPLTIAPLQHLRARSFARRKARASVLFLVGYVLVWSFVFVALSTLAAALRAGLGAPLAFGALCAVAAIWQVSPAKQWMLNRCHNRPSVAAFGAAADLDAWKFGMKQGGACAGACWALMAMPLALDHGALPAMALVAGLLFAERLDRPAPLRWRLRPSAKGLRLFAAQARLRLPGRAGRPHAPAWLAPALRQAAVATVGLKRQRSRSA